MRVLLRVQANWKRGDEHGGRSSVPKERSQRRKGLPVDVIDQQHSKKKTLIKVTSVLALHGWSQPMFFYPLCRQKLSF